MAAVITVGVDRTGSGLTAGALVGFMFLTYRFLEPIAEFTEILDQTQTAVAWRRVLAVLDTPIEVIDPADGVALGAPVHRRRARHVRLSPRGPARTPRR